MGKKKRKRKRSTKPKKEIIEKLCAVPDCGEKVQRNNGVSFCHSHLSHNAKQFRRYTLNVKNKEKKCIHCGVCEEHITRKSNFACRICYPKHNKCYIKGCNRAGDYYKRNGCCSRHGILINLQKNAVHSGRLLNIIKTLD